MKEIWRDIKGLEKEYQVSNLGRVRSLHRIVVDTKGRKRTIKPIFIKLQVDKYGYMIAPLKGIKHKVHRLVLQTFVPNPKNKPQVNHINGNKKDNRVKNLEWCTQKENSKHACSLGLLKTLKGESNGSSKLTEKDIRDLRRLKKFFKYRELAVIFDISMSHVDRIIRKKRWKHI